jgi:formamidopyrimidine-DNA glycosylase
VKARLLDQSVLAGVGNLLADETLWQAGLSPSARADELPAATLDHLHDALDKALRSAIEKGGVHTGEIIPFRHADASCPRCGAPMVHGTVGGRSTWWCSAEQA